MHDNEGRQTAGEGTFAGARGNDEVARKRTSSAVLDLARSRDCQLNHYKSSINLRRFHVAIVERYFPHS
jgi:hypothetical protein